MAGFSVPFVSQALTANGDTAGKGYVTVADVTDFNVAAYVFIGGTTVAPLQYQIVAIDTTANTIGVRAVPVGPPHLNGLNYGFTSVSQYTVADSARITQAVQFIYQSYTR